MVVISGRISVCYSPLPSIPSRQGRGSVTFYEFIKVRILEKAQADLDWFRRNDRTSYIKCFDLVREIIVHPREGTGKPERLKYFEKEEPIAKLPILSFPRRFWAGIQFVTARNHGCPIRAFGHNKTFCNYLGSLQQTGQSKGPCNLYNI